MIQIIKCETADSGHRTVALTVCLEIMRTLLQGLQEVENEGEGGSRNLNLEKNNHLCTFCAKFLDDFTLLDTPSCVQLSVLSSVTTHTTHGQRTTHVQKIKKGVVESLLKSGSGSASGSERENMNVNVGENVNVSVGSSSGSERDDEAIRLWLLSCDTDVISNTLSQIHSNTNTNTNTNFNSNSNTNSNTNSSLYSNSNDQNHISRSPLTSRNSSFIDGNNNNINNNINNGNSIAEKLIETRSRSHILLLLPIISSIVCSDNNSNSNNNGNSNNSSTNNNNNTFHNIDRDIDRDIHHNNSVCTGGRLVRASACRAIARVDMTALMDSFSSLEETNKKLLQENMRLRAQIESINSNAGGLPF